MRYKVKEIALRQLARLRTLATANQSEPCIVCMCMCLYVYVPSPSLWILSETRVWNKEAVRDGCEDS